jgi:predicted dehydrogenase
MAKLNIGIIGAGMVAQKHIESLHMLKQSRVSWLADLDTKLLESVLKKYGIPNGTNHYRKMLEDPNVKAVYICTPPSTHFEIFTACLLAGKHIMLEKPASISEEELRGMLTLAEQYPEQVILSASCRHSRLQPKFHFVKKIIDSGVLGEIYYIHHNAVLRQSRPGIKYHPQAKWFLDKSIAGGGPVLDWGLYDLSFHMGILSDTPDLVSVNSFTRAQLDRKDPGTDIFDVEEHAVSMLEFNNGLRFYWERGTHANVDVPNETRIYGTDGGLKFAYLSWDPNEVEYYYTGREGAGKAKSKTLKVNMKKHVNDDYAINEHFLDIVLNGAKPAMPLSLEAKHLRIVFEIYGASKLTV